MLIAVLLSLTLVLTTLIVHFQALRWTSGLLPRCGAAGMRMCHVQGSSGVAARNVPACMVQHGMVGAMDASSPSVCEEAQHGMCEDPCEDPRGFGTNNSQTIPKK